MGHTPITEQRHSLQGHEEVLWRSVNAREPHFKNNIIIPQYVEYSEDVTLKLASTPMCNFIQCSA